MAGRRGNNQGSITKRTDGRWEARIMLPDGTRKCFYGKNRREVERRLAEVRRDLDQGLPLVDEKRSVKDYLEWSLESVKFELRPSSWRRAKDAIVLHIIPQLGMHHLAKLTAQQVQTFYFKKLEEGLAAATVRRMQAVFHRALKDATRLGVLPRNVTDLVRVPHQTPPEMHVLTPDQARNLLASVTGDHLEALYVLALTTGMRRGELFGLRWQDIDLEAGSLQVRQSLSRGINQWEMAEPKTKYSRRRIALTRIAVESLRHHQTRQRDDLQKMGVLHYSVDLVFPNPLGGSTNPAGFVQNHFASALNRAGLPHIRFHDLRHTAATLMLSRGVNPKVVSEMLGHSSITITLTVYAHVMPDMQQAAVTVMDALFGDGAKGELSSELSSDGM